MPATTTYAALRKRAARGTSTPRFSTGNPGEQLNHPCRPQGWLSDGRCLQAKHEQGARRNLVGITHLKESRLAVVRDVGIDQQPPGIAARTLGQSKLHQIVMVVDDDQQR